MLKFYRKEIKWYTLKYRNISLNRDCEIETEQYQRWTFPLFFALFSMISLILWASGIGDYGNPFTPFRIILNIVRSFCLLLVYFLVRRFPRRVEQIIILTIIATNIFFVENNRAIFPSLDMVTLFLYGIIIQTLCLFLILVRVNFFRIFFILFFINTYSMMRLFYFENLSRGSMHALLIGLTNALFLNCFAYGVELYHRKIYFDMKKFESTLFLYEKLIKEIIPCSVIIYDEEKIHFTNKETNKILKMKDIITTKEKLEEIGIKECNYHEPMPLNQSFAHENNENKADFSGSNFYDLMKNLTPDK